MNDIVLAKNLPLAGAKFFTFDQNNSGGSWVIDDRVTYTVIIEAYTADDADQRAQRVGIYFDGCDEGIDCDCCGDRWSRIWSDGSNEPNINGKDPSEHRESWAREGEVYCRVYFIDGLIKEYVALDNGAFCTNTAQLSG